MLAIASAGSGGDLGVFWLSSTRIDSVRYLIVQRKVSEVEGKRMKCEPNLNAIASWRLLGRRYFCH
jgi:hypothetical protein